MPRKSWYTLDNAGALYSSIASSRLSTVYRMTAVLNDKVDPAALQKALDAVMPRFPYLNVTLRRGLFWYYYEYFDGKPRVQKESDYPCRTIRQKKGIFPFRILYYEKYIHLEMSHAICDGYGGLAFFKPLLVEYFRIKDGIVCQDLKGIIDIHSPIEPQEYEDAFKKVYQKKVPPPGRGEKAWHLPFKLLDKGQYLLITGTIPADALLREAKKYQCTLTQFITALYFESIQEYVLNKKAKGKRLKQVIAINIPVDLRGFFHINTLRNFFISLNPSIDLSLGVYTRQEIIDLVKGYMGLYINAKNISRYISRNVRNEELMVLRIIPLWIKRLAMPIIYKRYGESAYTSSVSNLGRIALPEELMGKIEAIQCFPPPSAGNKVKMVVSSCWNNLSISFGKTVADKSIERLFFRKIRKLGIPVKIEGNTINQIELKGGEH